MLNNDNLSSREKRDIEREYIGGYYSSLIDNKGIKLLEPMDDVRINRILDIAIEFPDMIATVLDDEGKKRILLRYKPEKYIFLDLKNLFNYGNNVFKLEKYEESIEVYLELLHVLPEPNSLVFRNLGLSYWKTGNNDLAIDYLTVAMILGKKEKLSYDYSGLIEKLRRENKSRLR